MGRSRVAKSSGKDGHRQGSFTSEHWTTFVPSKSKAKRISSQPRGRHGTWRSLFRSSAQNSRKSAATGADQACCRTRAILLHAKVIPLVDLGVAHAAGPALLVLPMLMHQGAKLHGLAGLEQRLAFQSELLDEMQVVDHVLVVCLWSCVNSDPCRIDPALRENPVKNSSRLSSRSIQTFGIRTSRWPARHDSSTLSSGLKVKHVRPPQAAIY